MACAHIRATTGRPYMNRPDSSPITANPFALPNHLPLLLRLDKRYEGGVYGNLVENGAFWSAGHSVAVHSPVGGLIFNQIRGTKFSEHLLNLRNQRKN